MGGRGTDHLDQSTVAELRTKWMDKYVIITNELEGQSDSAAGYVVNVVYDPDRFFPIEICLDWGYAMPYTETCVIAEAPVGHGHGRGNG